MAEIQTQNVSTIEYATTNVSNKESNEEGNSIERESHNVDGNDSRLDTLRNGEEENGKRKKIVTKTSAHDSGYESSPDGGYGWIIVIATFFGYMLSIYNMTLGSVFLVPIKEEFNTYYANLNILFSLRVGCYFLFAPLVSIFCNRFGSRLTVIIGGILQALGVGLAALAPSIIFIHLFLGLISGIGFSLALLPMSVEITKYFTTKRTLALSISQTGQSIGAILSAPILQYLIDTYGWRGALIIQAAIVFNITVVGALLRPINLKPDNNSEKKKLLDFSLFKSKDFTLYIFTDSLIRSTAGYFIVYIMAFAVLEQGYTSYQAVFLRSTGSIFGIVSRPILGMVTVFFKTDCFAIMTVLIGIMTLCFVIYPFLTTYWASILLFGLYGFCFSGHTTLFVSGFSFITGPNKLMSAFGLRGITHTPLSVLIPPLAGWLSDIYGTLRAAYWLAFGMMSLGFLSILAFSLLYSKKYRDQARAKDKE